MFLLKLFGCFTISDKVADCASDDGAGCCTTTAVNTETTCHVITTVKKFPWEEIKKRSKNFSKLIGSGGFSTVYLARLPYSGLTAVKIQSACTEMLAGVYNQELKILLRIKHPNIVKLIGYCDDREEERVLLFEYASNGTLHDLLHVSVSVSTVTLSLTWKVRKLIAFQLAEALEYLHGMHVIHGDIKASNILLDDKLNCKLCDFGSAKLGFTSMVLPPASTKTKRMIIGSQGYVDPDYLKTGLVSKKNDVYSFGVVLLELVSGREAISVKGERLTEVVCPVVEVEEVVDPRLRYDGSLDLEEVRGMVRLSEMCIGSSPMVRPCASEIVVFMRDNFNFESMIHL